VHHPRSVYWRRRGAAAGALLALAVIPVAVLGGGGSDGDQKADAAGAAPPPELPRNWRLFPDHRVVAYYGAPQDEELGALGIGTPDAAAARLERRMRAYERPGRPVIPALELIASVAASHPGDDGLYRIQQPPEVIDRYLAAARRHKALLLLDIQPGHADFMDEARRLEPWLRQPDVGLALDPEWATTDAVPGEVIGSVDATKVNEVAAWLSGIVQEEDLPQKLFVVHQFTDDMIVNKDAVAKPPGLAVTFNVDGFGDRANKTAKYEDFTAGAVRFHTGFKLFFREDSGLMRPRAVLGLRPQPDLVVYE
jgi:hypothetical protein